LTPLFGVAALALIGAFFVQGLVFIGANAQTVDESNHLVAGYSYLDRGDFRLNPHHPPLIKLLAALPVYCWYRPPFDPDPTLWEAAEQWSLGRDFLYKNPVSADRLLSLARVPTLLLGCFLVGLVGRWAYRLWGQAAALVGMALAAFEPNLLAHSCLVNTDLGVTFFTFLTLYLLWEYTASPSWGLLLAIGLCTGLTLVSKFSAVSLPFLMAAVVGAHLLSKGSFSLPGAPSAENRSLLLRSLLAVPPALVILCVAGLVIPTAYFSTDDSWWWVGLRHVLAHNQSGHPAFLLGEYSQDGWWYYFPVAFLLKTPLGTLATIGASLAFFRVGSPLSRRAAVFLLLPPALFFAAGMAARLNIGLRHVLPAYPFLLVLGARLGTILRGRNLGACLLISVLPGLTAVSVLRVVPHQLAYFNELTGGPAEGYRYLSDSNIDWGQDLQGVKAYMGRERLPMIYLSYFGMAPPEYYGIKYQYVPAVLTPPPESQDQMPLAAGRDVLAISVFNLQGTFFPDKATFRWLLSRTPVAKIGYSIYVYDLTGDAEGHRQLAEVYRKNGLTDLERHQRRKAAALAPGSRLGEETDHSSDAN
jgi:hypothetical protein